MEMNVPEEIIRQLIEQLEKRDYLETAEVNCQSQSPSCSHCPAKLQCNASIKKWILTTKGEKLAASA